MAAFGAALIIVLALVLDRSSRTHFARAPGAAVEETGYLLQIQITQAVVVWSILAAIALVTIASVAIWFVLRRTLRRLEVVTAAARTVGANGLDTRLPTDGPRDEVRVLAETINTMLDRLTTALAAQTRFVANASHELRTPLSTARTALDIPLAQGRVPADLEPDVRTALAANDRSARILDALLTLARTTGVTPDHLDPVDLPMLLEVVLSERAPAIEQAQVGVELDLAPAVVPGNEAMLTQVCANLIDNAIVHNRPGGAITVRCRTAATGTILEISNDGRVLDPGSVDALREPFHRGAESRLQPRATLAAGTATVGTGLGLGLAIVEEIVTRHGGTLTLASRPQGGLDARVDLPTERDRPVGP
ncbi:sensor histidine kinase [Cellulomonas denverensis]|uniref:sensor histidine kinase n=1 Tax=Cellulomonas denverensis TaxID=264297 RepID=UPI001446DF04|nr:HAMP domain-containing sensor histidine kinase [Cellulomonas denverensis]